MDTISYYRQKLLAILQDKPHYVKQLRMLRVDHLANDLLDLQMHIRRLATDRRRYRAATYADRASRLLETHASLLHTINTLYPALSLYDDHSPLRTVKVSITLRADQWASIDQLIANKVYLSRSDYFRRLFARR